MTKQKHLKLWDNVPKPVQTVIQELESKGATAFVVGGAVRDLLLHRRPHDWDVATDATPETIRQAFPNCKSVGANFGVYIVNVGSMLIEIARYRADGEYTDNRHPESVSYVQTIEEDLARRDFTINAFALNSHRLVSLDKQNDIGNGIVRCVGNPRERFEEDYLRVLRFFRFVATLDLEPESNSLAVAESYIIEDKLSTLAPERVRDELTKILTIENPKKLQWTLRKLYPLFASFDHNIRQATKTKQPRKYHGNKNVWEHMVLTCTAMPSSRLAMRWAALLHDCGKPAVAEFSRDKGRIVFYRHEEVSAKIAHRVLTMLRYPDALVDYVTLLISNHMRLPLDLVGRSTRSYRKVLRDMGSFRQSIALSLLRASDFCAAGRLSEVESIQWLNNVVQNFRAALAVTTKNWPQLAISGHDVMEIMEIGEGPRVGEILEQLRDEVDEIPEMNSRPMLRQRLRVIRSETTKEPS